MPNGNQSISAANLAVFCEQTAMLLRSGILLHEGLRAMAEDSPRGPIKEALSTVSETLAENQPFDEALRRSGAFPPYLVSMAAIGVESGQLDQVMSSLSLHYRRESSQQQTVKSAVLYPAILVVMLTAVLLVIAVKVLPVFQEVLQSLGTQLSPAASAILSAGSFVSRFSPVFAALILAFTALVLFLAVTDKGRRLLNLWFSKSKTSEAMALSTLSSSLSTLLSSGVDPDRAFELTLPLLANRKVREKALLCHRLLTEERLPFADCIQRCQLFSTMTVSLLSTGSRTGSLDAAMKYTADLYEEIFEDLTTKRLSLIEPLSVALLSVLMGVILIAVMFPLLNVMSTIGAQ